MTKKFSGPLSRKPPTRTDRVAMCLSVRNYS